MAKDSIITVNRDEARRIVLKVLSNIHCLNENDLKVLDHLGKKGFYDTQKAKLVPNKLGNREIPKIEKKYLFKPNII